MCVCVFHFVSSSSVFRTFFFSHSYMLFVAFFLNIFCSMAVCKHRGNATVCMYMRTCICLCFREEAKSEQTESRENTNKIISTEIIITYRACVIRLGIIYSFRFKFGAWPLVVRAHVFSLADGIIQVNRIGTTKKKRKDIDESQTSRHIVRVCVGTSRKYAYCYY